MRCMKPAKVEAFQIEESEALIEKTQICAKIFFIALNFQIKKTP